MTMHATTSPAAAPASAHGAENAPGDGFDAIARAQQLVPALRERAQEAEQLRRLPQATIDDAAELGLFQLLAPRAWGGYEGSLQDFVDVTRTLAQGCTSTAWTLSFLIEHVWMLARYPLEAQEEVRDGKPYALLAATATAKGPTSAKRVPGGYRVSGRWGFASGVMHSDWVTLTAPVEGTASVYNLLVPVADMEIVDVWHMSGMKATGSNDLVVDDAFVPEHLAIDFTEWGSPSSPGSLEHPTFELLRYNWTSLTNNGLAPIAVGAAEASLEIFRERMSRRKFGKSELVQAQSPVSLARLGRVTADLNIAQLLLRESVRFAIERHAEGGVLTGAERATQRLNMATASHLSGGVIREICKASGGGVYADADPLQRFKRDVDVLVNHHINDIDWVHEKTGAILLGVLEPDNFI